MKLLLISSMCLFTSIAVAADSLQAAKHDFENSTRDETARAKYVTRLATLLDKIIEDHLVTGRRDHDNEAEAIEPELAHHPAPKPLDPAAFQRLRIGKWHS